MKPTTLYRPTKGSEHGPTFESMTAASLWIIRQPDVGLWFCALVRAPVCACEAEGDLSGCGETADERNA